MPDNPALEALVEEIKKRCSDCPWKGVKSCTVPPEGPLDAEVVIIGRNPGQQEDKNGVPFYPSAPGGSKLTLFMAASGLNRSRCWVTNTAKCQGGKGDPAPTTQVYETCVPWVLKEIELLKPKVLIVLGNDAYHQVLGLDGSVTTNQGALIPTRFGETKAIPISHPGYWARRPTYFEDTIMDEIAPIVNKHLVALKITGLHVVNKCPVCKSLYLNRCAQCEDASNDGNAQSSTEQGPEGSESASALLGSSTS